MDYGWALMFGTSFRRARVQSACIAALLLLSAGAFGGKVKGRVENFRQLENPAWAESKDPQKHGFSFREPVPTVRAEFRRLFPHIPKELCIAALGAAKQAALPPVLIRVGGGRTTPVTIVVPPGTKLTFQNTDPFKHRLYGVGISTFPPNDTIKGGTRDWSVPGPGSFEIRDELAPSLRMFVIGEPNVAAISYPSMKGEFALTVKDPGEYTVQAFFAGKKVGDPTVVAVTDGDVDISKKPIKVAPDPKGKEEPKGEKPEETEKKEGEEKEK